MLYCISPVRNNFRQRVEKPVPAKPSTDPDPNVKSCPPIPVAKSGLAGFNCPVPPVGNLIPPNAVQLKLKSSLEYLYARRFPTSDMSPIPVSLRWAGEKTWPSST